jgi:hypothetical protein
VTFDLSEPGAEPAGAQVHDLSESGEASDGADAEDPAPAARQVGLLIQAFQAATGRVPCLVEIIAARADGRVTQVPVRRVPEAYPLDPASVTLPRV